MNSRRLPRSGRRLMNKKRKDQALTTIKIAPRRGVLVLGVLAASLALAACGSSSSTSTTTSASSSASAGSSRTARRAALVACLKQHGVTLPNRPPGSGRPPGAGGGSFGGGGGFFGGGGGFRGGANSKFAAAFKACGAQFGFRGRPGRFRLSHAAIQKFVTCVRQHGYNLPEPNFSGKGSVFPANIRTNPKFQAASRACASVLRPTGSGTTTTTSS